MGSYKNIQKFMAKFSTMEKNERLKTEDLPTQYSRIKSTI